MKVHRLVISVIDFDRLGADGVKTAIEDARYPNRCIAPKVVSVETADIGEWEKTNPLNFSNKHDAEFARLFPSARLPGHRVADLLHLLQFATITTPTTGDAEQAQKVMTELRTLLADPTPAASPPQADDDNRVPIAWRSQTKHGTGYSFANEFWEAFPTFPNPPQPQADAKAFAHDLGVFLSRWRAALPAEAMEESYSLHRRMNSLAWSDNPAPEPTEPMDAWSQRMADAETGQYVGAGSHGIPDEPAPEAAAQAVGPVLVDAMIARKIAEQRYGTRYGIDWVYHCDRRGLLSEREAFPAAHPAPPAAIQAQIGVDHGRPGGDKTVRVVVENGRVTSIEEEEPAARQREGVEAMATMLGFEDLKAAHKFIDWNRGQKSPPVVIGSEIAVFEAARRLAAQPLLSPEPSPLSNASEQPASSDHSLDARKMVGSSCQWPDCRNICAWPKDGMTQCGKPASAGKGGAKYPTEMQPNGHRRREDPEGFGFARGWNAGRAAVLAAVLRPDLGDAYCGKEWGSMCENPTCPVCTHYAGQSDGAGVGE